MKYVTLLTLLAGLLVFSACSSPSKASADVVARVNGKDITSVQLEKQFQNRLNGAEQPPSAEEGEDLKLQVLNQMINDQILLEQASAAGLSATDAEVDVKFNEFKNQYTEDKFKDLLKEQKMSTDDIRNELRKSITIDKLVNKEITSKISVTDAGKQHPILKDVTLTVAPGPLYKNSGHAQDINVLLRGSIEGHTEPIAWTRDYKGARIFYTELGNPETFTDENYRRMIANALFWVTKREPARK